MSTASGWEILRHPEEPPPAVARGAVPGRPTAPSAPTASRTAGPGRADRTAIDYCVRNDLI